jgi:hypothetical protein
MPLSQQIFLTAVVVLFLSVPLMLTYGWIVTKGWEQTPTVPTKAQPAPGIDHSDDLQKAA